MGNHSYLIATKNESSFTVEKICELIRESGLSVAVDLESEEAATVFRENRSICYLWKDDCYLLVGEDDEEKSNRLDFLIGKPCIAFTYGHTTGGDKTRTILLSKICVEYDCYWLDEGIHPEFSKFDDLEIQRYAKRKSSNITREVMHRLVRIFKF
jgi:hypothetical protein